MPEQAPEPRPHESHEHHDHGQDHSIEADLGSTEHACGVHCNHGESVQAAHDVLGDADPMSLDTVTETRIDTGESAEHNHGGHICNSHCSHGESKMLSDDVFSSSEIDAPVTTVSLSETAGTGRQSNSSAEAANTAAEATPQTYETAQSVEAAPEQAAATTQETVSASSSAEVSETDAPSQETTTNELQAETEATGSDTEASDTAATASDSGESASRQETSSSESAGLETTATEAGPLANESADSGYLTTNESEAPKAVPTIESSTDQQQEEAPVATAPDSQTETIVTKAESEPSLTTQTQEAQETQPTASSETESSLAADTEEGAVETETEPENTQAETIAATTAEAPEQIANTGETTEMPIFEQFQDEESFDENELYDTEAEPEYIQTEDTAVYSIEASEPIQHPGETTETPLFEQFQDEESVDEDELLGTEANPVTTSNEEIPVVHPEQTTPSSEIDKSTNETSTTGQHSPEDIEAILAKAEAITEANEIVDTDEVEDDSIIDQGAEITPTTEGFNIDQILANIEQLHTGEGSAIPELGTETENLQNTATENLKAAEKLANSEAIDAPTEVELNPPEHTTETETKKAVESVANPEATEPVETVIQTITTEITKLKAEAEVNLDTLSPLLEKHNLSLSSQQLEKLLTLLESGSSEQFAEYITGLLKLRRSEYRQEFYSSGQQDFTKQLDQKHQRLVVMLRKFLPKLVPINATS